MYPPATATGVRTLAEDTQLGDILVPAKTDVLVNILALHYDEEQWPEPNTFKPERFLKVGHCWVPDWMWDVFLTESESGRRQLGV